MFGPWLSTVTWLRHRMPKGLSVLKPNANFITLHCEQHLWQRVWLEANSRADAYIITWTLIGSVILYGSGGNLDYIDALFFASGAATQSGLNTCVWLC